MKENKVIDQTLYYNHHATLITVSALGVLISMYASDLLY